MTVVDKNTLMKRLMATFLEELAEHVAALNRDLLVLEKGASREETAERLKSLFRTAHSLKGAARSVNVELIESACHHLEEMLAQARDKGALAADKFAVLFGAADAIEEAGMRLREQQELAGSPLAALLPRLDEAAGMSPSENEPTPGAVPAPAIREPMPQLHPIPEQSDAPLPQATASELPAEAVGVSATVRVAAEKLDAFLARNGELLVARRRLASRVEDVIALRDFVGRWKAEWRAIEKPLAKFLGNGHGPLPRRSAQTVGNVGPTLRRLEKDLDQLSAVLLADGRALKEAAAAIDDEVRRVRMLPFAEACQGLDRMARDLGQMLGKEVELVVEGGDVELDRSVLEGLKDPLRHLVRNAVDHGLEPPHERRSAGKRPRGRLTVAAVLRGAAVEVVVADDGRGLDLEVLRRQLRKRQLPEPADARDLARVIFLPGFSTSGFVTDVSGRGVGLDVVQSRVEALHGAVEVSFTPGVGTRFTLSVPLTLTTLRVLLVVAGGQTFALVGVNVQRLLRVNPDEVRFVEGREMLLLGGAPVPLVSLAQTLGLEAREAVRPDRRATAVVVTAGDKRLAFVVEELLAEQEVVVKGLGLRVRRLRHVSAATILPSGRIALVLNTANLIRTALGRPAASALTAAQESPTARARKRLLVVDDSVTTRTLEKSILETAGYEVQVAADGAVAWQLLQERGADLIVSDVDMPRMDGFALTEAVRGSKRFADLPVVLVTARATDADRARGAEVGANAYLVKSAFEQKNLLETIAQLL